MACNRRRSAIVIEEDEPLAFRAWLLGYAPQQVPDGVPHATAQHEVFLNHVTRDEIATVVMNQHLYRPASVQLWTQCV